MNNNLKILLLPALLLAGCTKDIEVDLPPYTPKLYIYSVSPLQDKMYITVGRTVPIKEYKYDTDFALGNATVVLYENDKAPVTLRYSESLKQYVSDQDILPGSSYRIEVTAPGYEGATASASLPAFVIIEDAHNKINSADSFSGETEFTIRFTDPPTTGDHYTIDFISAYELREKNGLPGIPGQPEGEQGEGFGYDYGCISSNDPAIDDVANKDPFTTEVCLPSKNMLISDVLFNGQTRTIKFKLPKYYSDLYLDSVNGQRVITYPQVKLKHVSEAYVRYLRSYRQVRDNSGNPFVEPVNVYTNIQNGYGLFAPVSEDRRLIGQ